MPLLPPKKRIIPLLTACVVLLAAAFVCSHILKTPPQDSRLESSAQNIGLLLSPEKKTRETASERLWAQHTRECQALTDVLDTAIQLSRDDRSYGSPLHLACNSAVCWQAIDARFALYSIIDYRLDVSTIPLGVNISGQGFYPAASALIDLRVDAAEVGREISQCDMDSPRRIQLLTWVLAERAGGIEEAKAVLIKNGAGKDPKRDPLAKALALVSATNNTLDLLPSPYAANP